MVKTILEIGNARYTISRTALSRFRDEARQYAEGESAPDESEVSADADLGYSSVDGSLDLVFTDVMRLYNEYAMTESLDVLVKLKRKLEQVSLRYKSVALAEEVLQINSCLPYEKRVPLNKTLSYSKRKG